jgi:hypothetical protein
MSSLGGCVRGVTRVRAASGATRLRLPRPRRGRHLVLSWRAVRRASSSCPPSPSPVPPCAPLGPLRAPHLRVSPTASLRFTQASAVDAPPSQRKLCVLDPTADEAARDRSCRGSSRPSRALQRSVNSGGRARIGRSGASSVALHRCAAHYRKRPGPAPWGSATPKALLVSRRGCRRWACRPSRRRAGGCHLGR